jgi:hypothetical protein
MTMTISRTILRAVTWAAPLGLVALLSACELEVTNPGPIQAASLDDPAALAAIVNGAGRNTADALNWVAYTGAAVARELHPAGSTGSFGITVQQQAGKIAPDDDDTHWNLSQRARWTAEDAVTRVKTILGTAAASSTNLAQALVWAGYANRLLGEKFCDGVINGGAKEAYTVYLQRAEAAFTEAITVAQAANNTTLRTAATAGRASVRLLRNDLAGAATDAAGVTSDAFTYQMRYFTTDLDQYNRIYWATANQPYRAHTVWNTYFEGYRKSTRDPRVPFDSSLTILVGDGAVGSLGRVRWYFETKYSSQTSPINLSSGWEMRLIEGEAKLVAGDVPGAMTLINKHRLALGLPGWTATSAAEAWQALKRERAIELWMEGRRLGDVRRWAAANRPGAYDPLLDLTGRDLCFSTPRSEIETNPNF